MLYWSSVTDESARQRLWYCTTQDFEHFSEPEVLFDPGYTVIDGTLRHALGKWWLFYKDERGYNAEGTPNKAIRLAVSDSLYGPYEPVGGLLTGHLSEGPAVFWWQGKWYLAYEYFMAGRYALSESDDLLHWRELEDVHFPETARHGSFCVISRAELERLQRSWP